MRHFSSKNFKGGNFKTSPVTSTCRTLTLKHRAAKITDKCAAPRGWCFPSFPKILCGFCYTFIKVYKVSKNTVQDLPEVCSERSIAYSLSLILKESRIYPHLLRFFQFSALFSFYLYKEICTSEFKK